MECRPSADQREGLREESSLNPGAYLVSHRLTIRLGKWMYFPRRAFIEERGGKRQRGGSDVPIILKKKLFSSGGLRKG